MAVPLRKDPEPWIDEPEESYEGEFIFRYPLDSDAEGKVLVLPPTRENLLDPRVEDQIVQNNAHARLLSPLAVAVRTELEEREGESYGVFEDLLLLLKQHPGFDRDVSPDVTVVRGVEAPEEVDESLDVIGLGLEVPLVIEVVSTKYKSTREKDEKDNVPVFQRLGVHDYVKVYPRVGSRGERLRVRAKTRGLGGLLVDNPPDRQGRVRIRSLDLRVFVDEEGRLALEDVATGRRIWFHVDERRLRLVAEQRAEEAEQRAEEIERQAVEEAEARREAERRLAEEARGTAETLLAILESRGLALTAADRQRILTCRDTATLRRWTVAAVHVRTLGDLWDA